MISEKWIIIFQTKERKRLIRTENYHSHKTNYIFRFIIEIITKLIAINYVLNFYPKYNYRQQKIDVPTIYNLGDRYLQTKFSNSC